MMALLRGQKGNSDCGPTCFANALNLLGYDIKIEQANRLCNLTKDGTDSNDLIRGFKRYGFNVVEKEYYSPKQAWEWIIRDTSQGLPVILSVDNDSHWTLIMRAGKRNAQMLDPGDNMPIIINKKDLLERWQYLEENTTRVKMHGLSLEPFKNKSIKAVSMRAKLLATVDVR